AVEWGLPYGTALPYGVSYGVGAAPAQDPGSPRQSPAAAANTSRSSPQTEGVRVSVNVLSDHKDLPVLFVVRQKEAVVSFQVPLILRGLYQRKYAYQEVSRTLCQPQTKAEVETQHFYVDVSTLSLNASYQLRVTHVENFVLRTNERFSFNATAAQPGLGDCEGHPGGFGCWGLSPAAITVQKKDFPSNSFYVVVVVKTEDEVCGGALPYYPLSRDVPAEGLSWLCAAEAYVRSMLFCLGIFLSFYILTLLIACWESWHGRSIPDSFLGHSPYDSYGYGSFGACRHHTPSLASLENSLEHVAGAPAPGSLSSVEEDDYDTLADIDYDKNVIRTKQYLCVADLARKDKRVLRKKYQIYFWNTSPPSLVFYALPVVQLVITYQTVVNVTGNQDICYYNFLCAHPLGNLRWRFNNILSNLGYVLLGLLFLLIILQREINYNGRSCATMPTPCKDRWPQGCVLGGAQPHRAPFLPLSPPAAGVRHPQALWALLRHGHRAHDEGCSAPATTSAPTTPTSSS
uniref:SID1 transmembrane family member 2 n=1 Tax=Strigops habroptila TaxID=2489341 RepID=A0A672V8K9_STRHB